MANTSTSDQRALPSATHIPLQKSRSWGRYFRYWHQPARLTDFEASALNANYLPYGRGRSYGDSCLNPGGYLINSDNTDHFLAFDTAQGIIRCEAGVTLDRLHAVTLPQGWFVNVTPGTRFVTIAGAIANDVHGKNHWQAGSFGCHVKQFELLRSNGERLLCSPDQNPELFAATIGGLGLTGLITWADIQLKPVTNPYVDDESFQCGNLEHCLHLFEISRDDYEQRVAWIDCLAQGEQLGRSIFSRANPNTEAPNDPLPQKRTLNVPFSFPHGILNTYSVKAFNALYYRKLLQARKSSKLHLYHFHYPLDSLLNWNRIYGPRGFMQYQCVVVDEPVAALKALLTLISQSGQASFLSVLKELGPRRSPGMLSFPRHGYTLALDFPNKGIKTLQLFKKLDEIVLESNGAIYPAKDARMPADVFAASFSNIDTFSAHIDPACSSGFWQRVR